MYFSTQYISSGLTHFVSQGWVNTFLQEWLDVFPGIDAIYFSGLPQYISTGRTRCISEDWRNIFLRITSIYFYRIDSIYFCRTRDPREKPDTQKSIALRFFDIELWKLICYGVQGAFCLALKLARLFKASGSIGIVGNCWAYMLRGWKGVVYVGVPISA